jgi:hypothetical protein
MLKRINDMVPLRERALFQVVGFCRVNRLVYHTTLN